MANNIWWDIDETLSYNCLWNFVVGNRGCGKSYGFKKRAAKNFIKKGEQFIYVRRFKTEFPKKDKLTFWDSVRWEFPGHDLKSTEDGCFWIDGKLAGTTLYLSAAKSAEWPGVTMICFDEFITNDPIHHNYIPDEVTYFSELYETVSRMRDVKVFFLGNSMSWANPYFTFFHLTKPKNKKKIATFRDGSILVQLVENPAYIEAKEATRFGSLMKGTRYGDYAVHNAFYMDSSIGVEKRPGNAQYLLAIKIDEQILGYWYDSKTGKYYFSTKYSPGSGRIYALTSDDHDYNTVLLKKRPRPNWLDNMVKQYRNGSLFCETEMIRHTMLDILSIVGV